MNLDFGISFFMAAFLFWIAPFWITRYVPRTTGNLVFAVVVSYIISITTLYLWLSVFFTALQSGHYKTLVVLMVIGALVFPAIAIRKARKQ